AAFYALGVALASSRPVLVLVTSGTAAAEVHAAVCEADLSAVPLIVVSADRPPELHGVGAPQTIDQSGLYGPAVRDFAEPGVARLEAGPSWRPLARRLWRRARGEGSLAGPVHLNAAFVEPLVASPGTLPARGVSEVVASEPGVVRLSLAGRRVLVVAGARCDRVSLERLAGAGCVIVGDVTLHEGLAHADVVVRDDEISRELRPDLVIRLGGLPSSKVLGQRLREWAAPSVAVSWAEDPADPDGLVVTFVRGRVELDDHDHADETYATRWRELSSAVARGLGELELWSEPTVGAAVTREALESSRALVVGSSMPVRDVEWWAPTRRGPVYANRGANGIDGVVSTLCGVASVTPAIGLVGDLTMLHDVSALVDGIGPHGGTLVLVVANNHGGGIFSFLSQADLDHDQFETLFATPRPHNLERIVESFGYPALSVTSIGDLRVALDKALATSGLSVVVADLPPRDDNVALHRAWNDSVVKLLEVTP
ncbi:MAG: hypothetical protein B7X07_03735, partial [Actinobacteria bacterium 21-64-8]